MAVIVVMGDVVVSLVLVAVTMTPSSLSVTNWRIVVIATGGVRRLFNCKLTIVRRVFIKKVCSRWHWEFSP